MKTNWLRGACTAGLVVAGTVLAQTPDIRSFLGNGQLTWTNSDTNIFYRIEWAPVLTAPDAWRSDYISLTDIRSSESFITSAVPMFYRVCGSSNRLVHVSPVPKTGQTNCITTGDNGYYTNGAVWPNPRFTVGAPETATNCVTDNLTGLIWARNANLDGNKTWSNAVAYCENLIYGGYSDWRLPNVKELESLIDFGWSAPALCNTVGTGHWQDNNPFTGVSSGSAVYYWSSTKYAPPVYWVWYVDLDSGLVEICHTPEEWTLRVWPVRGGQ